MTGTVHLYVLCYVCILVFFYIAKFEIMFSWFFTKSWLIVTLISASSHCPCFVPVCFINARVILLNCKLNHLTPLLLSLDKNPCLKCLNPMTEYYSSWATLLFFCLGLRLLLPEESIETKCLTFTAFSVLGTYVATYVGRWSSVNVLYKPHIVGKSNFFFKAHITTLKVKPSLLSSPTWK